MEALQCHVCYAEWSLKEAEEQRLNPSDECPNCEKYGDGGTLHLVNLENIPDVSEMEEKKKSIRIKNDQQMRAEDARLGTSPQINFRVPQGEHTRLKALAREDGLSIGEFVYRQLKKTVLKS